jgi:hypothetical protein
MSDLDPVAELRAIVREIEADAPGVPRSAVAVERRAAGIYSNR